VLGITDGQVIEIKEGLTGDETIAVPGPNLPDAEGGGGGDGKWRVDGPAVVVR
jgi:hypothetical protein